MPSSRQSCVSDTSQCEPERNITYKINAHSRDSDQPAFDRLIKVLAIRLKTHWNRGYPKSDSDQPARMHSLIWVIVWRTCNLVGNAVSRSFYIIAPDRWDSWHQKLSVNASSKSHQPTLAITGIDLKRVIYRILWHSLWNWAKQKLLSDVITLMWEWSNCL